MDHNEPDDKNKEYMRDISEIIAECVERFHTARTCLVLTLPFFGILAAKLQPVINMTWCKTLATDGKHLFYNPLYIMGYRKCIKPEYMKEVIDGIKQSFPDMTDDQLDDVLGGLSDKNVIFAICHEILHCAYDHFSRLGMRDPSDFNRAADYAINQILIRDGIGEFQKNWLYDKAFEHMGAEEIYELLQKQDKNSGGGGGKPGGSSMDHHQVPEGTAEERQQAMDEFRSSMINAARAGGTPKEIARMVSDLVDPKIDWKSKIQRSLRSHMKSDLTYMNPSRRSWGTGGAFYGNPIYPGYKPDEDIDICVALDASGSISAQMLKDFLSEVVGITAQFNQFKIRILTFDTEVYEVHDYVTGDEGKILEYPVKGGGGTDFDAVWRHMKETEYCPKQLLMFTDGEPWRSWGDPEYCQTLFIIHSNPNKHAPFGETVHYEEEATD